ncbi:uncharacterized protein LOC124272250 [Haliotis rubra]|uniref:uncharacterized protein LOC124272250 n=1 Tax=Haliotis rubra TaxID=36100 RepID=UPI001EE59E19|nr:uncharacterized protein LOC124272250 [Haliotis rubra]
MLTLLLFTRVYCSRLQVKRRSTYDDTELVFDEEQIMLCTANKKLQSYAEKALSTVPTPSGRRVKKKNTVTFTTSTQTATDSKENKQNNGDCGVIDLEDTERGGEDETVTSCRDTTAQHRVFKDKDRACIMSSGPDSEISREKTSDKPVDSIPGNKIVNYKLNNKRNRTEKRTISTAMSDEPKPEVQRETTDTIDESSRLESASGSQDPKMDIKADVHCDSILEHPNVEDEVKINYTKSKFSNIKDIETVIEPPDEEAVRKSIQMLKLGNFTSELPPRNNAQFSIDVFDQNSNETVKAEQPKTEPVISVAKQQKKIDKMLKDIMGPVSDRVKKPPRKSKPKNGVINKGFQEDSKDTKPPSGDQVRPQTSDGCPFARRDGYSTLPLTKVNGGRSTAKSAEFETNHGGDFTTLVQPISAKRATKIRKKFMEKEEEKLFTPRILLEKDRNCFSDLEPVEDFTDVEGHAASDREGVVSPRVISVKRTDNTVSMDSVRTHTDTELELTDCDTEDMSVSESDTKAHARKTRSNKRQDRSQKGQYDSRRKYLALNSLRRKTKAKALNAEIRNRIRLAQS